jgi:tetratricopeptide (TPR) repeat protein
MVQGLGGSGKTQLVLDYVQKYREDYSSIFWVEAGQKESIERDYLQIYWLLFYPTSMKRPDTLSIEDAVVALKRWFHGQTERSLLVLDSADALNDDDNESYINLEFYLPDSPTVDVIITTRYAGAADMATLTPVEVGEMETTESAELFRKCAKLKSLRLGVDAEVLQIVAELGRLALAIMLAGSYIAATPRLRSDISLYLPEYRERRKQLLSMKAKKLIHQYGESVLSTWETSFAAVERQSATATRLLSLLAFLNFDDIFPALFEWLTGEEKLTAAVNKTPDRQWQLYFSPDGSADQYAIEAAFGVLQTYSLVQWRDDRGGYAMHKLIHAWGQDRLEVKQQQHLSLIVLKLLINIIPSATGNSIFGMRLVPHLMANFAVVSGTNRASATIDDESLDSIAVVGDFLNSLGRWSDEYEIRVFHFGKLGERAGKEHPSTLMSMNNLATVLRDQGKYEQAEEMYRQALRLRETILGKEHPDTLTSVDNLALLLSCQGKYEQAEEMHRQTIRLRETILGKEHPATLTSIDNLAVVLNDQGKYNQAEEIHQQTLKLRKTILGNEHPATLTSMDNLATVLSDQGKYEQAEEMHRQVLRLRETMLGKEHPATLTSMNNLATVLSDQGKYKQAEEMHRQTLRLRETILGKEHPAILASMNNLAVMLSDQGKYEQAEEMHRQTFRLRETVLGKEHPSTLMSMNNLATVLRDQGKYEQAEEMHRQALRLYKTVLGKEHPATLASMNNLALVLSCQGKYEQAEEIHRQTLRLYETILGKEHPNTLTSMDNLALVLRDQSKYEQAEEMHRRTLRLRETVLGKEHPATLTSMNNLATVLRNQGKYEQAE